MSRTWIKFRNCFYGIGINYGRVFKNTRFMVDEFNYEFDEYEEYVEDDFEKGHACFIKDYGKYRKHDCSMQYLLKKDFKEYVSQHRPELESVQNMPEFTVTCDKFIGIDETYGHPDDCWLVWGYELNGESFVSKSPETKAAEFYFPQNSKSIIAEFLARFYLKHCSEEKELDDEMVAELKKQFKEAFEQRVFVSLEGY